MAANVSLNKPVLEILYDTGEYSDLTIKCKGKVFNVHRSVVCIQSKPFAAMINGSFKEAVTGIIDLPDDEPEIIQRVVKFMYTTDYPDNFSPPTPETNPQTVSPMASLPMHVKVYIAADKWDIPSLKSLVARKYEGRLQIQEDLATFVASLQLIFDETPEEDRLLKDIALKFIGQNHKSICRNPHFVELCRKDGSIAVEAMKAISAAPPIMPACPSHTCNRGNKPLGQVQTNFPSKWSNGIYYCSNCGRSFNS